MSNEQFQFLMRFLNRIADDGRLNTSHISLCFALVICWNDQKHTLPFKVSRKILMDYGKIGSISTYHICIKELISFGFIRYAPSYNSYWGTLVTILVEKGN
ncbi:hypothetical protein [Mucilaginibacter sp.]